MVGIGGITPKGMEMGTIAQYIDLQVDSDYEDGYRVDLSKFFREEIFTVFMTDYSFYGFILEIHEDEEWNFENKKFILKIFKAGKEIKPGKSPFKELGKLVCRSVIFGY